MAGQEQGQASTSADSGEVIASISAEPSAHAAAPVQPAAGHPFNLWTVLVAIAGALVLARLYVKLRGASKSSRREDWDELEIERLRKQGFVPFKEYPVDFFLALPDTAACEGVRNALEHQGYTVDVKPLEDAAFHFSLHATRPMQLVVPVMHEQTRRMTALAEQFNGRYDGWAA